MAARLVSIFDPRTTVNPGTIVRLSHADKSTPAWHEDVGRLFMIGFYRPSDGIDCIWLVNEQGEYEQTTDRDGFLKYFTIVRPCDIDDYYGRDAERLPRWPRKRAKAV